MACNLCDLELYVKVIKYTKTFLAPTTPAEELRQKLEDLTGETYTRIEANFCPMCGEKLRL